eukprot:6487877-Amphidinium_carterae.1
MWIQAQGHLAPWNPAAVSAVRIHFVSRRCDCGRSWPDHDRCVVAAAAHLLAALRSDTTMSMMPSVGGMAVASAH